MNKILKKFKNFTPSFRWVFPIAIVLCIFTLVIVNTSYENIIPMSILCSLYVLAFLSLVLTVWSIVIFIRTGIPKRVYLNLMYKTEFTKRIQDDYLFRTYVFAILSSIFNVLLAIGKGTIGIITSSYWLIAFSIYYVILSISKMELISGRRNIKKKNQCINELRLEWKAYRLCGILLLVLTIALQGIVVLITKKGKGFHYDGILIYVVALYDFVCLISSIIYIIKNSKKHTPIIVAIKVLSLTTSLVAMLSLQTAMFAAFGTKKEISSQNMMNMATGIGVCLIVFAISMYMIINSNINIKRIRKELEDCE